MTVEARDREVELKLAFRPSDVGRLNDIAMLGDARVGNPHAEQLFTVYFDTEDFALRRAGMSLRLRHQGTKRIQSVKTAPLDNSLAANRGENDVVLNGSGPDIDHISDPDLRERVALASAGGELRPRFETQVLRTTRHVKTNSGDDVELTVDIGRIRADSGDGSISEIELELKQGSPRALYALARELNKEAPLRVLVLSKADRGYALLGETKNRSHKAMPVAYPADINAGDAFAEILRACLAHLMANEPALVEHQHAEGLHQMRVALRRLRTALALGCDRSPVIMHLSNEARWLSKCLAPARDFDVFQSEIAPPVLRAFKGEAAMQDLREAAEEARAIAWSEALSAVTSSRYTNFVLDLAEEIETRSWTDSWTDASAPAAAFGSAAIKEALAKAVRLGKKLPKLKPRRAHKLRKRLKRLRYTTDFFANLFDDDSAKVFTKRLNKLQATFGALNDAVTAAELVEMLINKTPAKMETLSYAGGLIVGWHRRAAASMLKLAAKDFAKLTRTEPFWA